MVWTGRGEYDGRVIIFIGVDIGRLLRRVYVILPASVATTVIVVAILVILSRDVVLVSLTIFWFGIEDFMLQSIKNFQINGGSLRKPPDQLVNASGEQ